MDNIKSKNKFITILFLSACIFSIIYILPPFNKDIINYDSAYQYCLTVKSPSEIARLIPEDYSPPLYSIILKLWTLIFGNSLAVMRSASLLVIWGMLFIAAFPIRKAFGKDVSVLCIAMFLFSSVNYMLVSEIRPTFFAYFFVTAACIYSYLAYCEDKKYAYICFTVFSVCAMYTHYIGLLAALAFYITSLTVTLAGKDLRKFKKFLISGIVCAVCYVPWLAVIFKQFGNAQKKYWSNRLENISDFFTKSFLSNYKDFGLGYISMFIEGAIPLCICALIVYAAFKIKNVKSISDIDCLNIKKHREKYLKILYCILLYVLPFAIWILFSVIVHPIMARRYYYIFCGTSMAFFAVLTAELGKKAGVAVLCILSAVNFGISTFNMKSSLESSRFTEMIEYISEENPDGNIAFLHSHEWTLGIMMYYFPEAHHYIADDTWCVLNTYDVFPSDVVNIGKFENIENYEDDFYIFGGDFPDTDYILSDVLSESGEYSEKICFGCEEPYTYQRNWELIYVESNKVS